MRAESQPTTFPGHNVPSGCTDESFWGMKEFAEYLQIMNVVNGFMVTPETITRTGPDAFIKKIFNRKFRSNRISKTWTLPEHYVPQMTLGLRFFGTRG